ncbi:MAG: DNA-directed RNA polymerase subunit omega [Candidatus Tectomicrobia bacterium]|nr:DNA-directed RNA polymerase subunit omega [Candidatus Tectomicrobia bacterium]
MDDSLITQAASKVGNRYLLINIVTRRIKQLKAGSHPLVETESESHLEVALREVIAGNTLARFPEEATEPAEAVHAAHDEEPASAT